MCWPRVIFADFLFTKISTSAFVEKIGPWRHWAERRRQARLLPVAGGCEERVDIDKFDSDRAALADPPDYARVWQTAILDHAADSRDADAQPLGRAGNRDRDRFDLVFRHRASLVAVLKTGRLAEAPAGQIAMLSPALRAAVPYHGTTLRSITSRQHSVRLGGDIFDVGSRWVTTR